MDAQTEIKTEQQSHAKFGNSSHALSKVSYLVALLVLCAASGGGAYLFQHKQVSALNTQLSSLTTANKSLTEQKAQLDSKNATLSKSLQQLQQEVADTQQSAANNSRQPQAPPSPTGKFAITAFKNNELLSDFNTPGFTFPDPTTVVAAAYITMTNLTDSTQSYNIDQFYGTSSTGAVVPTVRYAMSPTPKIWWQSQIAAGGTQNIVLLWPKGTDIKTLSWTPSGGTATYTLALPAPTSN